MKRESRVQEAREGRAARAASLAVPGSGPQPQPGASELLARVAWRSRGSLDTASLVGSLHRDVP